MPRKAPTKEKTIPHTQHQQLPYANQGTRGLRFGLPVPQSAPWAWGFRGIKEAGGFSLLPDRQSTHGFTDKTAKVIGKALDTAVIPPLRKFSENLRSDDPKFYEFEFDSTLGKLRAFISPAGSYGYIYGCVFPV